MLGVICGLLYVVELEMGEACRKTFPLLLQPQEGKVLYGTCCCLLNLPAGKERCSTEALPHSVCHSSLVPSLFDQDSLCVLLRLPCSRLHSRREADCRATLALAALSAGTCLSQDPCFRQHEERIPSNPIHP